MHSTMLLLLFVLFVDGVSGADPAETLTVREGDSVPLHTGLTEILNDDTIVWMFVPNSSLISQITRKKNVTSFFVTDDVGFRGRLQVDQNTGSLTIRNTRERHSGQYQVTISSRKTTSKTFNFIVQRVASGTGGVKSKSVSVMEGETVTLNPDKTQIHGDDLVLWTFGDILLAKIDVENKQISLNDADEGYRDRLQLNQTGSLNITNTRTTDSGLYHLQIRGSESSQQFILTVRQPGLSSGGKAGIVVAVLLVLAAAAAGFIYHRHKISELRKQILTVTVTVTKGEDVILKPNKTIQKGDGILWMFGDEETQTSIAKLIGETGEIVTHDYAADWRFSGRLDLDKTTGSLTISNSRTEHSGLYTLYITSSSGDSEQRFIITVSETLEKISVEDGGTVTLNPDTEIQEDDQIQWIFGDQDDVIAEIRGGTGEICIYDDDAAAGRFRDRLKLEKTGSLTITDVTPEHTGLYELQIITSRGTLCKRFWVYMQLERVYVIAGDSIHLSTDRPKIERDDEIQWRFGDEIIAVIKGGTGKTHDGPDERFRDRLQLDKRTGYLTIKNCAAKHIGRYKLKIRSRKGNKNRTYCVIIIDKATGKPLMKRNNDESAIEMQSLLDE